MGGYAGTASDADDQTDEATFAVIAHGLLNSLTVVKGAADMVRASFPELPTEQVQLWFDSIHDQTEMMADILVDVVRGLPPQALIVLDELARDGVPVSGRR
ncbi:MAG TPA: histidine kinase dimerization/phospho-acceptor domain-containing protein [Mycobacteriales bacterium]|nr:histidine kinase dimerization/phospho-acceptor domain-containing protein [Mycobacteriales bacterium]